MKPNINSHLKKGSLLLLLKQKLITLYHFFEAVVRHFIADQGLMVASSVAYSFLLSLVPFVTFLTIFLGYIRLININAIRHFLEVNLVLPFLPSHQKEIMSYLDQIIANANTFGLIGFFSFLLGSTFFLNKMSNTFNWIYNSPPRRKWIARLSFFLVGLILFALILMVMILLLTPTLKWFETQKLLNEIPLISHLFNKIHSWIISFLALLLMMKWIPSAKVKWESALFAASGATIAIQVTTLIFTKAIATSFRYQKLYGSLAAVVIFLLWINWISVMIYFALEMAYVHQYKIHRYQLKKESIQNPFHTFETALSILHLLAQNQQKGKECSFVEINQLLSLPEGELWSYLWRLEQLEIVEKHKRGFRFLFRLKKELNALSMNQIIEGIFGKSTKEKNLLFSKEATERILQAIKKEFEGEPATWLLNQK